MLLPVLVEPDPFLKTKAREVVDFNSLLSQLVNDMIETMYHEQGVGLAASQVGSDLSVVVVDPEYDGTTRGVALALVNPKIVQASGVEFGPESCLSVPGATIDVPRSTQVIVEFVDVTGAKHEAAMEGFAARVVQHELDHLEGRLLSDYLGQGVVWFAVRALKKLSRKKR